MTRRKKLLKSSSGRPNKKNSRRTRNRIRKLGALLIPIAIISCAVCLWLITVLINKINSPLFISPISGKFLSDSTKDDKFRLELIKNLEEKKVPYLEISHPSGTIYKIVLKNSGEVTVSSQKDVGIQISSLQYILTRLTMEGKEFLRLDLSFDKPVIVLK